MIIFSQNLDIPMGGTSGWAGAGLLGLVLMWLLLKHLPSKDKQLDKMVEDQEKRLKEREDKQDARIKEIMVLYEARSKEREAEQDTRLKEKDELLKSMLATKTAQLQQMIASQEAQQRLMHEQNQKALQQVVDHCKDEMKLVAERSAAKDEVMQHSITELTTAITDLHDDIKASISRKWLPPQDGGA